jgi:biopolymer transport protein ExbD
MANKHDIPQINGGALADISFLLLIFFLIATTMKVDTGLARILPPIPDETQKSQDVKIKERNIFIVLINKSDRLLVNNADMNLKELRQKAKEFIENPYGSENLPEFELKPILIANPDYFPGSSEPQKIPHKHFESKYPNGFPVSKGVISMQNDRGTSYKRYIEVQNELIAAYNELRDELSIREFGRPFNKLLDQADVDAIRVAIPQKISEAEPKNIGGK